MEVSYPINVNALEPVLFDPAEQLVKTLWILKYMGVVPVRALMFAHIDTSIFCFSTSV